MPCPALPRAWPLRAAALALCLTVSGLPGIGAAQAVPLPRVTIGVDGATRPEEVAVTLQIVLLLTVLSLAPAILIMVTSFTRIVVVLSFLRQALGTQHMPPNQIIVGLSLFLSFFIMAPVWQTVNERALRPYMAKQLSAEQALEAAGEPVRQFMARQTREKDLALFASLARLERPAGLAQVPTHVLIPAFIISELRTAFQMGFLIYVPFLVLDMVVASILMSMGMLMLPPIMISLPFKLMLFVLVDGWHLLVGSLVRSFQ
ncbi:MAG: flagellar type III secretion system pore protein FliP [Deltaproteobacteria bacterium]|nr:flagellar type III secretion system pore protein FliP [Deltaproteobacteria bacterium]MBI3075657.1 flagellar type III secretion system pore protein FliP [Deltaproteobacteria bacterium]